MEVSDLLVFWSVFQFSKVRKLQIKQGSKTCCATLRQGLRIQGEYEVVVSSTKFLKFVTNSKVNK